MRGRDTLHQIKFFQDFLNSIAKDLGIDGYLYIVIFVLASIGLATIGLKSSKQKLPKMYKDLTLYTCIGIISTIILKFLKLNFLVGYLGFAVAFIINIIIFLLVKRHIEKNKPYVIN